MGVLFAWAIGLTVWGLVRVDWLGERGQARNWTSNGEMCERGQLVVASDELIGAILGKGWKRK